jgi:hypothetical protein
MEQLMGRRRSRSLAQWQALFAEQADSGLSQYGFCQSRGVSTSAFYNAKARLKNTEAGHAMAPVSEFIAVSVEPTVSSQEREPAWEVELTLGAGVVLRIRRGTDGD